MNEQIKGNVEITVAKKSKYRLGGFIGSILGFATGVIICKYMFMDILPLIFPEFRDVKEVILIISDQISNYIYHDAKKSLFSKIMPKFVGGFVDKIKFKLFMKFKVDAIPSYIKVIAILLPFIIIILTTIIGSKLGSKAQKALSRL